MGGALSNEDSMKTMWFFPTSGQLLWRSSSFFIERVLTFRGLVSLEFNLLRLDRVPFDFGKVLLFCVLGHLDARQAERTTAILFGQDYLWNYFMSKRNFTLIRLTSSYRRSFLRGMYCRLRTCLIGFVQKGISLALLNSVDRDRWCRKKESEIWDQARKENLLEPIEEWEVSSEGEFKSTPLWLFHKQVRAHFRPI